MGKFILVVAFICLGFVQSARAYPPVPGNWKLTFSDEFNTFDKNKWSKELPNGLYTIGKSKSFFLQDNVTVEDGELILISRKEKIKVTDSRGKTYTTKYTSGYADTFGKFTQRYGYFEVRMKSPLAKGLHPAFWLMPDRGVKPGQQSNVHLRRSTYIENGEDGYTGKGMEIDISEHLTKWKPTQFHYAIHWDGYGDDMQSVQDDYNIFNMGKKGYVKFGLLWKPGLLVWYANDVEIARQERCRIADVPMSVILSTEMGGWAGRIKSKALPDYTFIDYVKVWQDKK